ncbi:MAG: hypothetical protein AAGC44_14960 [Planctomycetota bacterium]
MPDIAERYAHSHYNLRRKVLTLIGAKFHIYAPDGSLALFAKMKGFKIKEDIRLYADEEMTSEMLAISTKSVFDIAGTYDVRDTTTGETLGALRRKGLKSMIRDEWLILDPQGAEVGKIVEDSQLAALVRRFIEMVSFFLPQKYHAEIGGSPVAEFKQNMNPFVHRIAIDFSMDRGHKLDPRLGLAAAVLLCAIEGRQS